MIPVLIKKTSYKGIKITLSGVKIGIKYAIIALLIRFLINTNISKNCRKFFIQTRDSISRVIPNNKEKIIIKTDNNDSKYIEKLKDNLVEIFKVDIKVKS